MAALSEPERAKLRGTEIAYVPQSAAAAFNPAKRLIDQVIEVARIHRLMPMEEARARAVELFRALALPDPETIGQRYPHQVSGGQLQRLSAAMALIGGPKLMIFDEPTTALDVTTQIEVLRAFKSVMGTGGMAGVYVSHDLAVVAQMADRIVVLRGGEVQEQGPTATILDAPTHPYTRELLAAFHPKPHATVAAAETAPRQPVLEVRRRHRRLRPGRPRRAAGQGRRPRRQLRARARPQPRGDRRIRQRQVDARARDRGPPPRPCPAASGSTAAEMAADLRGRSQGPAPPPADRLPARRHGAEPGPARSATSSAVRSAFYHGMKGAARDARVAELLDMVRLPAAMRHRLPGELSGGQKQRVNLARALAAEPSVVLCDEITSALDTVVAQAVIELLKELQRELDLSYVFISHDLSTVRAICDDVMVMLNGEVVERLPADRLQDGATHPYSKLLFASVPKLDPGWLDSLDVTPGMRRETREQTGRTALTLAAAAGL